jgi:hypothetical protein
MCGNQFALLAAKLAVTVPLAVPATETAVCPLRKLARHCTWVPELAMMLTFQTGALLLNMHSYAGHS